MRPSDRIRRFAAFALFAGALATPAHPAKADAAIGDYVGKTPAEITRSLERQGYRVREFEVENELFEVEATRDGKEDEIHVDPRTGRIVKIEADD